MGVEAPPALSVKIVGGKASKLATQPACNCWETSNTRVQPLLGSNQKKFFWRVLTEANSEGFYYNELDL